MSLPAGTGRTCPRLSHVVVSVLVVLTYIGGIQAADREMLLKAVLSNDTAAIRTAVKSGVSPDACDRAGTPVLMRAAAMPGATAAVHTLLSLGARVNGRDKRGRTALFASCADSAITRTLLERGAMPDIKDKEGWTPLMCAVQYPAVAAILLAAGADPNARAYDGTRVLWAARHSPATLRLLLEHGAALNALPLFRRAALSPALAAARIFDTVMCVTVRDSMPIVMRQLSAARPDELAELHFLLAEHLLICNKTIPSLWYQRLAAYAVESSGRKRKKAAEQIDTTEDRIDLAAYGSDTAATTALRIAVKALQFRCSRVMGTMLAGLQERAPLPRTVVTPMLFRAVSGNDTAAVRVLVGGGRATVDTCNRRGITPLARAAEACNPAMVALLVELGARRSLATAYHAAHETDCAAVRRVLERAWLVCAGLTNGTPTGTRKFDSRAGGESSLLHLIVENMSLAPYTRGAENGILLLLEKSPALTFYQWNEVLWHAALFACPTVAEAALKAGADPNYARTQCANATVLMAAAGAILTTNRVNPVLGKILERGADIHMRDSADETALFYAARQNNNSNYDLLVSRGSIAAMNRSGEKPHAVWGKGQRCLSQYQPHQEERSPRLASSAYTPSPSTPLHDRFFQRYYAVTWNSLTNFSVRAGYTIPFFSLAIPLEGSLGWQGLQGSTGFMYLRKMNSHPDRLVLPRSAGVLASLTVTYANPAEMSAKNRRYLGISAAGSLCFICLRTGIHWNTQEHETRFGFEVGIGY